MADSLTENQRTYARRMAERGVPTSVIAKKYGVAVITISRAIVRRKPAAWTSREQDFAVEAYYAGGKRGETQAACFERIGKALGRSAMAVETRLRATGWLDPDRIDNGDPKPRGEVSLKPWPPHARFDVEGRNYTMKPLYA